MINVLIVDDEPITLDIIKKTMSWHQFDMKIAGYEQDGEKALSFIENNDVDVIFTDLKMPHMGGLELIERISKIRPEIIFVVLSSYSEFNLVRESFKFGVYDYLLKIDIDNKQLTDKLLNNLKLQINDKKKNKVKRETAVTENDLFYTIKEYINDNYYNPNLSLLTLENELKCSKRSISTCLHKNTNMYFKAYLNKIRMNSAIYLLENTNLRVNEVSEKVGYLSTEHFSRLFSSNFGMSPSQYANECKKQIKN